jgi:hypothetical protein
LRIQEEPLSIEFLSAADAFPVRHYENKKYSQFNRTLQALFEDRHLLPSEYQEYYHVIEKNNFEPEALIQITAYAINLKGVTVNKKYIIAIAENFASQNITTAREVKNKIELLESVNSNMGEVFGILGKRGFIDFEDRNLYLKWQDDFGFDNLAIKYAAKKAKSLKKLDVTLENYHAIGLKNLLEIEAHDKKEKEINDLTYKINKKLGVYYETIDNVKETYVIPWLKAHTPEALLAFAQQAFKQGFHSLSALDNLIKKTSAPVSEHKYTTKNLEKEIQKNLSDEAKLNQAMQNPEFKKLRTQYNQTMLSAAKKISEGANPSDFQSEIDKLISEQNQLLKKLNIDLKF